MLFHYYADIIGHGSAPHVVVTRHYVVVWQLMVDIRHRGQWDRVTVKSARRISAPASLLSGDSGRAYFLYLVSHTLNLYTHQDAKP
jgi:hypothetical protein